MPIVGTILEEPTIKPFVSDNCLPYLSALSQIATYNAIRVGILCLVIGFLIGAVSMYYNRKFHYGVI